MPSINPSQLFVIFGLLLILTELLIGIEAGFDMVVIGSIFILGGFAGMLYGGIWTTLGFSIILTILYFIFLRKLVKTKIASEVYQLNTDRLINKKAVVTTKISKSRAGRVRIDQEEWRARGKKTFNKGEKVVITKVEGVTVHVKWGLAIRQVANSAEKNFTTRVERLKRLDVAREILSGDNTKWVLPTNGELVNVLNLEGTGTQVVPVKG